MADTKLSALTADASPTTDDLIYVVNDPGGTPASRKVTLGNTKALFLTTGSTDNAILRADGTGGSTLQNSGITIDDTNNITFPSEGTPVTYTIKADNQATSNTVGNEIDIKAGKGNGTANGGALLLNAGDADTGGGNGGAASFKAGWAKGVNGVGGAVTIQGGQGNGSGAGGFVFIEGGNAGATSLGGELVLWGGDGNAGNRSGGPVTIRGGWGRGSGTSGNVVIVGGEHINNNSGTPGTVSITGGGAQDGSGIAGANVTIKGGAGGDDGALTDSNGGNLILGGGAKAYSGTNGLVKIVDATSGIQAALQTSTLATSDKTFTFPNATGTFVLNDNTAELTNKTLNASVGKGTWTASGTWTLPAITLGGTVSGGGNNLNNIIIGATTPLAGTFTLLTASKAGLSLDVTNSTDATSNQVSKFSGTNATRANNDLIYQSYFLANSSGTQKEFARVSYKAPVVTNTSEDGSIIWSVMKAGTLTDSLLLTKADLKPVTNDGLALGTTALMWSDLFLADGGVINFNNGNATLTHSSGLLTSNVALSLGTSNALTAGSIELGHASDTTISRASAGVAAVEGNNIVVNTSSPTLATITTTGNIELGNASDTTIARVSAGVVSIEGVKIPTTTLQTNTSTSTSLTITSSQYGSTLLWSPGGTATATLPANGAAVGSWFDIILLTNQTVTISAATADTLITDGDTQADSVAFSTTSHKIGSMVRFISDGTSWIAINIGSTTMTIAT